MARDYAKKNRPAATRRGAEARVPAWVWLFTGAVLGAFIMFLMRLAELPQTPAEEDATSPTEPVRVEREEEPAKPRFDFYDMLKDTEVAVPDPQESSSETEQDAALPVEYILQVASFRTPEDADRLRAELILLNLEARVQAAQVRNGETWHRVLVGPFTSRSKMAKARSTLMSNHHEALVLKRQLEAQ